MINQTALCSELRDSLNRKFVGRHSAPFLDRLEERIKNPDRLPIGSPKTEPERNQSKRRENLPIFQAGTLKMGEASNPFWEEVFAIDLIGRKLEHKMPVIYVQSGIPARGLLSLLLCSLAGATCALLRDGIYEKFDTVPGKLERAFEVIQRSSFALLSPDRFIISRLSRLIETAGAVRPLIVFDRSAFSTLSAEAGDEKRSGLASRLHDVASTHGVPILAFPGTFGSAEECDFTLYHDKGAWNDNEEFFTEPTRMRATFKTESSSGINVYDFDAFLSKMRLEDAFCSNVV